AVYPTCNRLDRHARHVGGLLREQNVNSHRFPPLVSLQSCWCAPCVAQGSCPCPCCSCRWATRHWMPHKSQEFKRVIEVERHQASQDGSMSMCCTIIVALACVSAPV